MLESQSAFFLLVGGLTVAFFLLIGEKIHAKQKSKIAPANNQNAPANEGNAPANDQKKNGEMNGDSDNGKPQLGTGKTNELNRHADLTTTTNNNVTNDQRDMQLVELD